MRSPFLTPALSAGLPGWTCRTVGMTLYATPMAGADIGLSGLIGHSTQPGLLVGTRRMSMFLGSARSISRCTTTVTS